MIGRAGRPQFKLDHGRAVVMCGEDDLYHYQHIQETVESCESKIRERLVEHLNTEFCRGNLSDESDTLMWIKSTFLYVRCTQNPKLYGMGVNRDPASIERALSKLCLEETQRLLAAKMIEPLADGSGFKSTHLGQLMAKFYLSFETCKEFPTGIPDKADLKEMLVFVCSTNDMSGPGILRFNQVKCRCNSSQKCGDDGVCIILSSLLLLFFRETRSCSMATTKA
jgi:ATP-dependent DNA helicase HFM1/MER3